MLAPRQPVAAAITLALAGNTVGVTGKRTQDQTRTSQPVQKRQATEPTGGTTNGSKAAPAKNAASNSIGSHKGNKRNKTPSANNSNRELSQSLNPFFAFRPSSVGDSSNSFFVPISRGSVSVSGNDNTFDPQPTTLPVTHSAACVTDSGGIKTNTSLSVETDIGSNVDPTTTDSVETGIRQLVSSLSDEQRRVIDLVRRGQNVFVTGYAGTGKTHTLGVLIQVLSLLGRNVVSTAPTGMAATKLNQGLTIHSALGLPVSDTAKAHDVVSRICFGRHRSPVKDRWARAQVLVIDEASMLHARLFELIDEVAREVRARLLENGSLTRRPFGGLQLILCGDFLQLPPIDPSCLSPRKAFAMEYDRMMGALRAEKRFCFQSPAWSRASVCVVELTDPYRQKDESFVRVLAEAREGYLNDESDALFETRTHCVPSLDHTIMTSTRKDAGDNNSRRLDGIAAPPVVFTHYAFLDLCEMRMFLPPQDLADIQARTVKPDADPVVWRLKCELAALYKQEPAPYSLTLKVGSRVILCANLEQSVGLVNGSQGTVVGFSHTQGEYPAPTERPGENKAKNPVDNAYDDGSTVNDGEYLSVAVRFDGSTRVVLIGQHQWTAGSAHLLPPEESKARARNKATKSVRPSVAVYRQVPLLPGWAVTTHKCQGSTLGKAVVMLEDVFDWGQAYVAVSRVRSFDGLVLRGYRRHCFHAHPAAVEFYSQQRLARSKEKLLEDHARHMAED